MPSVSVDVADSGYVREQVPLGMGINHVYRHDVNTPTKIENSRLEDTKMDTCCSRPQLTPADVDAAEEERLRRNFPAFSDAIHNLIETRREYMAAQAARDSEPKRCLLV